MTTTIPLHKEVGRGFELDGGKISALPFPGNDRWWVAALPNSFFALDRAELLRRFYRKTFHCLCAKEPVSCVLLGCCLSLGLFWFRQEDVSHECAAKTCRVTEPTPLSALRFRGCLLESPTSGVEVDPQIQEALPVKYRKWSPSSISLHGSVLWCWSICEPKLHLEEQVWCIRDTESICMLITHHSTKLGCLTTVPLRNLRLLREQNPFSLFLEPLPIVAPQMDFENGDRKDQMRLLLISKDRSQKCMFVGSRIEFLPSEALEKGLVVAESSGNYLWSTLKSSIQASNQNSLLFAWHLQLLRLVSSVAQAQRVFVEVKPTSEFSDRVQYKAPPLLFQPQARANPEMTHAHTNWLCFSTDKKTRPLTLKDSFALFRTHKTPTKKSIKVFRAERSLLFEHGVCLTLTRQDRLEEAGLIPCCESWCSLKGCHAPFCIHHMHGGKNARPGVFTTSPYYWELRSFPSLSKERRVSEDLQMVYRVPVQTLIVDGFVITPSQESFASFNLKEKGQIHFFLENLNKAFIEIFYSFEATDVSL